MEHCNAQNLGSKQGFRNSIQQSMFNTSTLNKTGTLLLHPSASAFQGTGKSIQIGEKRVNHFLTQHSNASLAEKSIQYSDFNQPEPILPDYISKTDFQRALQQRTQSVGNNRTMISGTNSQVNASNRRLQKHSLPISKATSKKQSSNNISNSSRSRAGNSRASSPPYSNSSPNNRKLPKHRRLHDHSTVDIPASFEVASLVMNFLKGSKFRTQD